MIPGQIALHTSDLPLVAACYDRRGRLLGCSKPAEEFLHRWPDLADRFVAVSGAVTGDQREISRGGRSWRIEVISALLEGRQARLVLALYTPPPGRIAA